MEGTAESQSPDLRDVEGKVGRKTPEGLLRGLRGEWEPGTSGALLLSGAPSMGHGLGDKIMALRMELVSVGSMGQGDGVPSQGWKGQTYAEFGRRAEHYNSPPYSSGYLPDQSLNPGIHFFCLSQG